MGIMIDLFNFTVAASVFLIFNGAFAFIIWKKRRSTHKQEISSKVPDKKVYQLFFFTNVAGGLAVGIIISLAVLSSSEPSYFLMPLVLAPFGYWTSFSIPIIVTLIAIKKLILKK